jgi:hypothetical protein
MTVGRTVLLFAVLAAAPILARASPLDADACTKLLEEHGQLEQAGVEADMAKGPEWAKANLVPDKLARIRRFIEIEGQLLFRCRQKSLVDLPNEVENGPAGDKEKDKNAGSPRVPPSGTADKAKSKAPPAAKKKSTQPAKKAAPTTAAKPASKPATGQTKQASDRAKAPAKAKPAAKQPAGAKAAPAPPAATTKDAPKAKDGN